MIKSKNLIKLQNYRFFSKFKNKNIRSDFFTFKARLIFIKLR